MLVTIFVPVYHASVVCASWQCAFATFTIKRYFISPLLESRLAFLVTDLTTECSSCDLVQLLWMGPREALQLLLLPSGTLPLGLYAVNKSGMKDQKRATNEPRRNDRKTF